MSTVSGEILEISLGTPAHPVDGLSILCRATNPLGKMRVVYIGPYAGPWFGPIGVLNLMGVAAYYACTRGVTDD